MPSGLTLPWLLLALAVITEREPQTFFAIQRGANLKTPRGQSALDEIDDSGLVLDQDDMSHSRIIGPLFAANPGKESSHVPINGA